MPASSPVPFTRLLLQGPGSDPSSGSRNLFQGSPLTCWAVLGAGHPSVPAWRCTSTSPASARLPEGFAAAGSDAGEPQPGTASQRGARTPKAAQLMHFPPLEPRQGEGWVPSQEPATSRSSTVTKWTRCTFSDSRLQGNTQSMHRRSIWDGEPELGITTQGLQGAGSLQGVRGTQRHEPPAVRKTRS